MNTPAEQVDRLIAEASRLPTGLTKYELLDEAVRIADLHQDVPLGIRARIQFMWSARSLLRGDMMATAFTWCLYHYDRQPELFEGRNLLDEYRELIGQLANFDNIPRSQFEEMWDDFAQRLHSAGLTLQNLWQIQLEMAPDLGDRELSVRSVQNLQSLHLRNVPPTEDYFRHLILLNRDDEALEYAKQNLFGQEHQSLGYRWYHIVELLLKYDMPAELRRWQNRLNTKQPILRDCYYWEHGIRVISFALSGRITEAIKLCSQCQRGLREYVDPLTKLHFCIDMTVLFERLKNLGRETVFARFTDAMPGALPSGHYRVQVVLEWLQQQAIELAARFDKRNGNPFYTERIAERQALQQYAKPEQG